MLTDDGVYMINIIDKYTRDRKAIAVALFTGRDRTTVEKALAAAGMGDAARMAKKIVIGLGRAGPRASTRPGSPAWPTRPWRNSTRSSPRESSKPRSGRPWSDAKIPMRRQGRRVARGRQEILRRTRGPEVRGLIPSWAGAAVEADVKYAYDVNLPASDSAHAGPSARGFGSFLGSWVETARKSFGPHVYVFGTASATRRGPARDVRRRRLHASPSTWTNWPPPRRAPLLRSRRRPGRPGGLRQVAHGRHQAPLARHPADR